MVIGPVLHGKPPNAANTILWLMNDNAQV
jgi:hypothetical protein